MLAGENAANPGIFPPPAELQRLEMLRDFDPKLRRDAVADVNRDQDVLKKSALALRRIGGTGRAHVLAKMPDKSFNPSTQIFLRRYGVQLFGPAKNGPVTESYEHRAPAFFLSGPIDGLFPAF